MVFISAGDGLLAGLGSGLESVDGLAPLAGSVNLGTSSQLPKTRVSYS